MDAGCARGAGSAGIAVIARRPRGAAGAASSYYRSSTREKAANGLSSPGLRLTQFAVILSTMANNTVTFVSASMAMGTRMCMCMPMCMSC